MASNDHVSGISTLPSVFELEHLLQRDREAGWTSDGIHCLPPLGMEPSGIERPDIDPFDILADHNPPGLAESLSAPFPPSTISVPHMHVMGPPKDARILSPEARTRLGRMSMAPPLGANRKTITNRRTCQAPRLEPTEQMQLGRMDVAPIRYSLPSRPKRSPLPQIKNVEASSTLAKEEQLAAQDWKPSGQSALDGMVSVIARDTELRPHMRSQFRDKAASLLASCKETYLAYRLFVNAALSLLSALLLTATHSAPTEGVPTMVQIGPEALAGATSVNLGLWGWCQAGVSSPQCQTYGGDNMAKMAAIVNILPISHFDLLSLLMTALTTLTWILASIQTVTAFLHFYLLFALSLPLSYLVQAEQDTDPLVREVNIRVKCMRAPYEGYEWVWWAWWGHRRGPLVHLVGMLVGVLSVVSFILVFALKNSLIAAMRSTSADIEPGGYIPLVVLLLELDVLISAMCYLVKIHRHLTTLLHPPDPSPIVLLLPESQVRSMKHVRQANQSFFAPHQTEYTLGEVPRAADSYLM
ncbi:hypothetical protein IAU60_006845 [Kwoniella sp. DSM 27419]